MITPRHHHRPLLVRGLLGLVALLGSFRLVHGQAATQAPATTSGAATAAPGSGDVVKLSAFEVSDARDKGYSSSHAIGATRTDTPLNELPQAITVINQQYIRDWLPDNVMEAGKFVSGVTEAPTQMIRGLTGISPAIDGLSSAGHYDMAMFERVEFLKGPSAIIYGDGNKSGVISRASKKPRFDRASNVVDVDIGSWDFYRVTLDTTRPFGSDNQFSYRVIGSYLDRGGEKSHDYGRRRFIAPMFGWRIFPKTTAIVQVSDYHEKAYKGWGNAFVMPPYNQGRDSVLSNEIGIPRTFAPTEPFSYNQEQTRRYTLIVDQEFTDWWSARLTGSMVDHLNTEYTAIPRDLVNQTQMQRSWRNAFRPDKDKNLSLDSFWRFKIGPTRHKLLAYARYGESEGGATQYLGRGPTGSTTNVLPLLDIYNPVYGGQPASTFLSSSTRSESQSLSVSFQEQAYLFNDRLILQGGIRYSQSGPNTSINHRTGAVSRRDRVKDWSDPKSVLGAVYKITQGLSVYLSMSEIFSANSGVQPDGSFFEPNVSDSDEVGIKADLFGGKVSALATAYRRRELNRIISHPDPALASLNWRLQVPGDELTGYELDLYLNPITELQFNVSFTSLSIDNLSGLNTRSLPDTQYSVMGRYEFSKGRLKNLAFGLAYLAYDERAGDAANSYYLDPYDVMDGFVSYRRGQYRFQLNLFNLLDADDEHTSINRNIINLLPARRFMFRVSREF